MNIEQKTHPVLFTLVCVAEKKSTADALLPLFRAVGEHLPFRLMLLIGEPFSPPELPHCDIQVHLLGEGQEDEAFFWLLPRLVADLPLFTLWGESLAARPGLFGRLLALSKRVIVDLALLGGWRQHAEGVVVLAERQRPYGVDVVDVAWAKLCSWRTALSQLFSVSERGEILADVERITFSYCAAEGIAELIAQPLYLQGWMATALGWKLQAAGWEGEVFVLRYRSAAGTPTVVLTPLIDAELPVGTVRGLCVQREGGRGVCDIRRLDHQQKISVHIERAEHCELPLLLPLPRTGRGVAFLSELFYRAADPRYLDVLKMLAQQG